MVPLLVPEGLPGVTVNAYSWGWARRRDTVVACLDNGVWDRLDREENWMVAVWDTRPEYPQHCVDCEGEGREALGRLGGFYAVGSYLPVGQRTGGDRRLLLRGPTSGDRASAGAVRHRQRALLGTGSRARRRRPGCQVGPES